VAHAQIDVAATLAEEVESSSFFYHVNIWRKNKAAIAVAASFILLNGGDCYIRFNRTTQQSGSVELVSRELAKIKNSIKAA
jgi:serine protease Do